MKKLPILLILAMTLVSCGDEDASLVLNFKALYDGQTFLMFDELPYGENQIQITDADFFISNIELTNENNEAISFDVIDFVDFTNTNIVTDPESQNRGIDIALGDIPEGRYTSIRFGIGVDEEQNKSVPADFSSDHVLSMVSHYWEIWDSYIFMKFQGLYKTEGQEDLGFVFHIGNNELYREVELPIDLTVSEGEHIINIALDHKSLLDDNGELFDIPSSPSNHQPTLNSPMFMIVDNFPKSFVNN